MRKEKSEPAVNVTKKARIERSMRRLRHGQWPCANPSKEPKE